MTKIMKTKICVEMLNFELIKHNHYSYFSPLTISQQISFKFDSIVFVILDSDIFIIVEKRQYNIGIVCLRSVSS